MGSAWSLKNGLQIDALDWFGKRYVRARALIPAANFDTVVPVEFENTITSELFDTADIIDAFPVTTFGGIGVRGGAVGVTAGDSEFGGSGSLHLTGAGAHVQTLDASAGGPWYVAGLTKIIRPADPSGSTVDGVGLRDDTGNHFAAIGMRGPTSTTNWVGAVYDAPSLFTVLGPALDSDEGPVWRLFEIWNDGALIHFAIDELEFTDTIAASDAGNSWAQLLARIITSSGAHVANGFFEKWCAVVKSMTVGEP